jgi:hypothetical protein
MSFRKVEMLKRGDELETFRVKACPAQAVIRRFARKKRIGCNGDPVPA